MKFKDFEEYNYAKTHDGYIPMEFRTKEKGAIIVFNEKYCFVCATIEKPANGLFKVEIGKLNKETNEFELIVRKVKSFMEKQTAAMSVEYEGGPGTYKCEAVYDAKTGPGRQKIFASEIVTFT